MTERSGAPAQAEQRAIPEIPESELPGAITAMLFAASEPARLQVLSRTTGYDVRTIRSTLEGLAPELARLGLILQWTDNEHVQHLRDLLDVGLPVPVLVQRHPNLLRRGQAGHVDPRHLLRAVPEHTEDRAATEQEADTQPSREHEQDLAARKGTRAHAGPRRNRLAANLSYPQLRAVRQRPPAA
jgi:hypothetical protein